MKAYLAIYSHKYGDDYLVFDTLGKAEAWKNELARDYWFDAFPETEVVPENPGETYFNEMSDMGYEWFNIEEKEVL